MCSYICRCLPGALCAIITWLLSRQYDRNGKCLTRSALRNYTLFGDSDFRGPNPLYPVPVVTPYARGIIVGVIWFSPWPWPWPLFYTIPSWHGGNVTYDLMCNPSPPPPAVPKTEYPHSAQTCHAMRGPLNYTLNHD